MTKQITTSRSVVIAARRNVELELQAMKLLRMRVPKKAFAAVENLSRFDMLVGECVESMNTRELTDLLIELVSAGL